MKGLVLKDVYNVLNNGKGLLMMMLILALAIVPTQGFIGFIVAGTIVCSMMSTTSFAIDHNSKWEQFAIALPIDRKDIVKGKFVTLLLFTLIGLTLSIVLGSLATVIFQMTLSSKMVIKEMGQMIILSASVALIFGTNSILLLLKFGAEKARMFLILGYVIPGALIIFMLSKLNELGVVFTEKMLNQTLMMLPFVVIIWLTIGYSLSVVIMNKKQY